MLQLMAHCASYSARNMSVLGRGNKPPEGGEQLNFNQPGNSAEVTRTRRRRVTGHEWKPHQGFSVAVVPGRVSLLQPVKSPGFFFGFFLFFFFYRYQT